MLREDGKVRGAAFSWVEHCDWMPALLTGTTDPLTMKRSRCAAGHKAMWHTEWEGLPPEAFLVKVDPLLRGLRARLYTETHTSDVSAGGAHGGMGEDASGFAGDRWWPSALSTLTWAPWAAASATRTMVKIMGTSTCDMLVAPSRAVGSKCIAGHLRPGGRLRDPRHGRPGGGTVGLR